MLHRGLFLLSFRRQDSNAEMRFNGYRKRTKRLALMPRLEYIAGREYRSRNRTYINFNPLRVGAGISESSGLFYFTDL